MESPAAQSAVSDASSLEQVQRQQAQLRTSIGWLLGLAEFHAALVPPPEASLAERLRRAASTLSWNSDEQEKLLSFAERAKALDAEADAVLAGSHGPAPTLAVQLEKTASEGLALLMAMQIESARAAELSRPKEEEENSPARLRARAEIGAAVRTRLAAAGAVPLPAMGLELLKVANFLDQDECAALIDLIERDLFPSGVLGENVPGYRTSKSCNLMPTDPPVDAFEVKVCALLGINRRFSEVVQGQRYEVGQEFKPHHDFFHRGQSYYKDVTESGGQRTWTAMLFLNRPEAGGHTDFPAAGTRAEPEAGTLLIWNNMDRFGRPNHNSLHHGTPVLGGQKYVLTKWFRERPLVF